MYLQHKNRSKSVLGGFIYHVILRSFYSESHPLSFKRAGFTLIELLVVVLIIGILAAIALPQYQTAVAKSRLATLMPIVKSLKDGAEMYRLAKGHYPVYTMADVLGSLDVSLPGNCVINADNRNAACGDQRYSLVLSDSGASGIRGYVQGSDTNGEVGYVMHFDHSNLPGKIYCLATRTNKAANNVCKSMGGVLDNSGLQWSINSIPCYGYLLN